MHYTLLLQFKFYLYEIVKYFVFIMKLRRLCERTVEKLVFQCGQEALVLTLLAHTILTVV